VVRFDDAAFGEDGEEGCGVDMGYEGGGEGGGWVVDFV